ncbi:hypothetical protein CYY_007462 [Polysphondylium violaceum]|uniref:mRNA-decapping enzyme-like protein n=1 Tax=Polysphondylium violaceum TaxID=133409 RepID=A0A8J4PPQ3_9MYCE|nr:hypothetical protein CYY_007462 [Polysphondylium violaceum]
MNRDSTQSQSQQQKLSALQRLDNKIYSILGTSTHTTAYKFEETTKQWSRKDIEGALFVVNRTVEPYCKLIVLNRLSTKNLMEDITEKMIIKCSGPYLLYKNSEEINGIWFYENADQEKIFNLLKESQKNPPIPPPPQQQQQQQPQQQMLMPGIPPPGFMNTPNPNWPHMYMMQPQAMNQPPPHGVAGWPMPNNYMNQPQTPVSLESNHGNIPTTPLSPSSPLPVHHQSPSPSPSHHHHHHHHHQQPQQLTPNKINQEQEEHQQAITNNTVPLLSVLMNSVIPKNDDVENANGNGEILTKKQLQDSLRELVEDDKFITMVYNSYISDK